MNRDKGGAFCPELLKSWGKFLTIGKLGQPRWASKFFRSQKLGEKRFAQKYVSLTAGEEYFEAEIVAQVLSQTN